MNLKDCYDAVRALDDRMIHYDGMQQWTYTDMTSFMYPSYSQVVGFDSNNDSRPHFLCEYAHTMGQAIGNLSDYWEYIESSKRTIGGCIWDWVDQAIYHPEEIKSGNIKGYYTGYDFPGPHQGNFEANGIVGPMREPTATNSLSRTTSHHVPHAYVLYIKTHGSHFQDQMPTIYMKALP